MKKTKEVKHSPIECPVCETKVKAIVLESRDYGPYNYPNGYYEEPIEISFLECPFCKQVMLGFAQMVQTSEEDWDFSIPKLIWPVNTKTLDAIIPPTVRSSIEEARKCLKARAYSACAVMSGRALEALCKEQNVNKRNLAEGLRELKTKGIIDGRLFDWSESLREKRNIGAHASEKEVSKEDASDVLDFTIAICEFVYVLTDKYENFKNRQNTSKSKVKSK